MYSKTSSKILIIAFVGDLCGHVIKDSFRFSTSYRIIFMEGALKNFWGNIQTDSGISKDIPKAISDGSVEKNLKILIGVSFVLYSRNH